MNKTKKLISVLIPNYNYAKYLPQCLESVLSQTYDNIEVIFCDNNSSDNSYEVALNYCEKFKRKKIRYCVLKNESNIGSYKNALRCIDEAKGEYLVFLSSDDFWNEDFIARCSEVASKFEVSMVIAHRNEVDDDGNIKSTIPFYNKSCIIKGRKQAAVHMMAGIAVPSQCIMKSEYVKKISSEPLAFNVAADWYYNFNLACMGDVGYIKQPLCNYRVHFDSESAETEKNLTGIFEHCQLINYFLRIATNYGYTEVINRYDEAIKKLAKMSLRYAMKMLVNNELGIAKKYLQLAPVFDESIKLDTNYIRISEVCNMNPSQIASEVKKMNSLDRKVSYDPPEGSIDI